MLVWPDLRQRDRQPEWMDQPNLDPAMHEAALVGLSRLNAISGAVGMLWPPLARLAQALRRPLRVLDLAAGGGDTLIALGKRAARDRIRVELVGCDISPQARTLALSQAARAGVSIGYETVDLLNQPLPAEFDAIICSLFLHHLDDSDIVTILRKSAEAAAHLVLMNDLVRSPMSYALVWASCRVVTRSPMVQMDGPLSIRAALTPRELRDLAHRADGIDIAYVFAGLLVCNSNGIARMNPVDVLIVGAGPAGAVAAYLLARRGLSVRLVDRAVFPRWKVCGCCLNARAVGLLNAVGLGHLLPAAGAVPLADIAWATRGAVAMLPLGGGRALSREQFDQAIIDAAVANGAIFQPEIVAEPGPLTDHGRIVTLTTAGVSTTIEAKIVIAADGLAGRFLPTTIAPAARIGAGVTLMMGDPFYTPGRIWMATAPIGYVGLTRLEDGRLDVAAALDRDAVRQHGGPALAAVAILEHVGWPIPGDLVTAAWRGTPPLTRRADHLAETRLFGLGDAVGYVEPFTGEGMSWAIAGAAALAPIVADAVANWDQSMIQKWTRAHHRHVGHHQRLCRFIAAVMRRPALVGVSVRLFGFMPKLAGPLVRKLHTMNVSRVSATRRDGCG